LKPIYPEEIIPSESKKLIGCDISNQVIFRFFNEKPNIDIIDDSTGFINQIYICDPSNRIYDLSTNLLGKFNLIHGKLNIIGKNKSYFINYCNPNDIVDKPKFKKDFEIDNSRKFWFILIDKIDNYNIPYKSLNKDSISFDAECKIFHTPVRSNYWHFSIRWLIKPVNAQPFWLNSLDQSKRKKYVKKISTMARVEIAEHAKIKYFESQQFLNEVDYTV